MANDLEVWWSDNYLKFSIGNLETLDIYTKFQSYHEPFYRLESDSDYESFNVSPKSLQYTLVKGNTGEKLTLYSTSKTWKYEKWLYTPELAHTWKTWKNGYAEWGIVANGYPDKLVKESWKKEGGQKVYEVVTVAGKETVTKRCGVTEKEGKTPETWTENVLESSTETRLERIWTAHNASGSEIRGSVGNRHYGEISIHSSNGSEKKRWTLEGDCEKGTCTVENQNLGKFTHKWHRDGKSVNEEHVRKAPADNGQTQKVGNGGAGDSEAREKVVALEAEVAHLKAAVGVNRAWMREKMTKVSLAHLVKWGKTGLKEVMQQWLAEAGQVVKSPRSPPMIPTEEVKGGPLSPRSPPKPGEETKGSPNSPRQEVPAEEVPADHSPALEDPASAAAKKGGVAAKKGGAAPAAAKKSGSNTPVAAQPSGANTPNPKKAGTPPAPAAAKKAGAAAAPAKKAGKK